MSPEDQMVAFFKSFRSRRAGIDTHDVDVEIEMVKHGQLVQALQSFCKHVYDYKVPLTQQEWNAIQGMSRGFNASIINLSSLVAKS